MSPILPVHSWRRIKTLVEYIAPAPGTGRLLGGRWDVIDGGKTGAQPTAQGLRRTDSGLYEHVQLAHGFQDFPHTAGMG